jgi:hypothetical protein
MLKKKKALLFEIKLEKRLKLKGKGKKESKSHGVFTTVPTE